MTIITLDDVRRALELPDFDVESAWLRMVPLRRPLRPLPERSAAVRPAGVLILLYPSGDGKLCFALTRRTENVATHKGQISLPGGAQEPGETPADAALREACEEIGICDGVMVIGQLTPLFVIVSDFEIFPLVGYLPQRPEFHPVPDEVAEVIEMSLDDLLDDSIKTTEKWTLQGMELDVTFYSVGGHAVWGATAILLSEFETRLRHALDIS